MSAVYTLVSAYGINRDKNHLQVEPSTDTKAIFDLHARSWFA